MTTSPQPHPDPRHPVTLRIQPPLPPAEPTIELTFDYDVFLSHSGDDSATMAAIASRLAARGLTSFLDRWHLQPGDRWQPDLSAALAGSATAAICIGPHGVTPWQNEEMQVALNQAVRTSDEFRLIPVLLPGASPGSLPPFLALRTWVDFREGVDDAAALDRLIAGIRGEAWSDDVFALPDEPAPYRGLLRYEAEHAEFFFGREREVNEMLSRLASHRFLGVIGASGSGKSSLVRAGLIPALAAGRLPTSEWWTVLTMTPGTQPIRSLADAVASLHPDGDRVAQADQLAERFSEHRDGLRTAIGSLLTPSNNQVVLVLDQLEELFTNFKGDPGSARQQRSQFIGNLAEALEGPDAKLRIVSTLRADFVGKVLAYGELKELLQDHELLLGPLDEPALREAIAQPARHVGAIFEKGLVTTILRDVQAQPGALPLLQHALYELWRQRRGPWLTIDAYERTGGVTGALHQRAEATYGDLSPDQQDIARHVLLRLTTLGEGSLDTRRRVGRAELYPLAADATDVDAVLNRLSAEDARLIVVDDDTVEIAHEALLHQWTTLRHWVEDGREAFRIHRRLTVSAHEWKTTFNKSADLLYVGVRLNEAEEWASHHQRELNAGEAEFLEASRSLASKRRVDARRRIRRLQLTLAGAVAALVAAVIGGGTALVNLDRVQEAGAEARTRALAESSMAAIDSDPRLAGLLALDSLDALPNSASGAATASYAALYHTANSPWLSTLSGHDGAVWKVDVSRDGQIVTGSTDGSALVWSLDGSVSEPLIWKGERIEAVQFSPDGSRVVVASGRSVTLWTADAKFIDALDEHAAGVSAVAFDDRGSSIVSGDDAGVVRIWHEDGSRSRELEGHTGRVNAAAFSPDGQLIVTASADGTARIWSIDGDELATVLHDGAVNTAIFSPDGLWVLTASDDDTARLWKPDGESGPVLEGHRSDVNTATFSADGEKVVTTSRDWTAGVWDLTGARLETLGDHSDIVWDAEFSNDGELIVTVSRDGTARVWSSSGVLLSTVGGGEHEMRDAAFGPQGDWIVTASDDGDARRWQATGSLLKLWQPDQRVAAADVEPGGANIVTAGSEGGADLWSAADGNHLTTLAGHVNDVSSVAYNDDGTMIVTAGKNGEAVLWTADGAHHRTLPGHGSDILDATFSADGLWVAIAGADGVTRLWTVDGQPGALLGGHGQGVRSVSFSPDGHLLVTASDDGTARIWSAEGTELATLPHEGRVWEAEFSADGTHVVTAGEDDTAKVWDVDGKRVADLDEHTGDVRSAAFRPDGRQIATASADGTARLWDIGGGQAMVIFSGHSRDVIDVAFSVDGERVVTASLDGTARVWDRSSGVALAVLGDRTSSMTSAQFAADGRRIVTTDANGRVQLWESWSFEEATAVVRELVDRSRFTRTECLRYDIDPCPSGG